MPADSIGEYSLPHGPYPTAPWHRQYSRTSPPSLVVAAQSGCLASSSHWPFIGPSASDWQQFQHAWAGGLLSFVRANVGPIIRLLLGVCCSLLGVWTVVGLGAALALARSWFVGVGGLGSVALIISLLVMWSRTELARPAFAVVCLVGTLTAFLAAYRLRAISTRMMIACCAIYLLLCMREHVCLRPDAG